MDHPEAPPSGNPPPPQSTDPNRVVNDGNGQTPFVVPSISVHINGFPMRIAQQRPTQPQAGGAGDSPGSGTEQIPNLTHAEPQPQRPVERGLPPFQASTFFGPPPPPSAVPAVNPAVAEGGGVRSAAPNVPQPASQTEQAPHPMYVEVDLNFIFHGPPPTTSSPNNVPAGTGAPQQPDPSTPNANPNPQGPNFHQFFIPFYMPLPQFFHIFGRPNVETERPPDFARSALIMRALEKVDPELLARWERVGGEEAKCAVCLEALRDPPPEEDEATADKARQKGQPTCPFPSHESVALPCHHAFHAPCVFPWLANHTTCPTCRFDLDPSSLTLPPPVINPGESERYRPYPTAEARRKWVLPTGPAGKSLRESVKEKEREQGWTCSDPSCVHTLPLESASWTAKKPDVLHLATSLNPDVAQVVCKHAYHPECLVGAVRARLERGVEHAPGGVWVECGLCRNGRGGWVTNEKWDEGVRGWEAV